MTDPPVPAVPPIPPPTPPKLSVKLLVLLFVLEVFATVEADPPLPPPPPTDCAKIPAEFSPVVTTVDGRIGVMTLADAAVLYPEIVVSTITAPLFPPVEPFPPNANVADTDPPLLTVLLDDPPLPPPPPMDWARMADALSPVTLKLPIAFT